MCNDDLIIMIWIFPFIFIFLYIFYFSIFSIYTWLRIKPRLDFLFLRENKELDLIQINSKYHSHLKFLSLICSQLLVKNWNQYNYGCVLLMYIGLTFIWKKRKCTPSPFSSGRSGRTLIYWLNVIPNRAVAKSHWLGGCNGVKINFTCLD